MAIAVNDILKVVAVLAFTDGNIMQNVFNALVVSGAGPFDDDDVVNDCEDWLDAMYANLTARMTNTVDGSEVRVYKWDTVGLDWDEVGSSTWVFNPTGATTSTARGISGLINAKTTNPDVSGKKYLGGLTQNDLLAALLSAGYVTQLALFAIDWYTNFVGAASGATFGPGIWSPTDEVLYDMTGDVLLPVIPAYQRRRKQGVGI